MRALSTFYHRLTEAAGRAVPARSVDLVVGPLRQAVDPAAPVSPRLEQDVIELCRRLGLVLTKVAPRADEAARLAHDGRAVLLLVRRGSTHELVLLRGDDDPQLTVEWLRGGRLEQRRVTVADFTSALGLQEDALFAAFQVASMGSQPAEAHATPHDGKPLRRLWTFLAPDRAAIWLVVGFAIGVGILGLATPVAVQALVNVVAFGSVLQPVAVLGTLLFAFLAFSGTIRVFKSYIVEILQRRVFVRVVSDMSVRLPRVRLDAYDRGYGPELVNRFFDVVIVQKAVATLLIDGLDMVLQAAIGLLLLGFYHPYLLVFDVVLVVVIGVIVFGFGRSAVYTAIKESKVKYQVAGALEELARSPVTYKLQGAPELARARLADLASHYIGARRKHFKVLVLQQIGAVSLHAIASTVLLTLGGLLVIDGALTLGQLIAAELIVSIALSSFVKFGKQLEVFYDMLAGVDKLGALYDLPLEASAGDPHDVAATSAAVEVRGLSYAYPGRAPVIDDLSFAIKPGEHVAILGRRGSGKSTLGDLLCGLREAQSGLVMFDGVDVRSLACASVRAHLSLAKGFEIVEGDIIDNVRLGRSDVTLEEVRAALALFGILDELMELPDGLHTKIAVTGAPLSTRTVRLLMLARSVVGDARAVVVDDLLDELDPEAVEHTLRGLRSEQRGRTLIVLTARTDIAARLQRTIELPAPARLARAGGAS